MQLFYLVKILTDIHHWNNYNLKKKQFQNKSKLKTKANWKSDLFYVPSHFSRDVWQIVIIQIKKCYVFQAICKRILYKIYKKILKSNSLESNKKSKFNFFFCYGFP